MNEMQARVAEFHEAFGAPVAEELLRTIPLMRVLLRHKLIQEELTEYLEAALTGDTVKIADALADLLVVVFGTAVEHGIPAEEMFWIAMNSNMSKLGEDGKPIYREDGKILKGPNFVAPEREMEVALGLRA